MMGVAMFERVLRRVMPGAAAMLLLVVQGCHDPGAGSAAYVVIDREARAAGISLEVDGRPDSPVLPREIDTSAQRLSLVRRDGIVSLSLRPGEIAHIRGVGALTEFGEIGVAVDGDQLRVDVPDDGLAALEAVLGARASAREEGFWVLRGPDVLRRSAWIEAPEGVVEVAPARAAGSPIVSGAAPEVAFVMGAGAPAQAKESELAGDGSTGDAQLPALVGIYRSGTRHLTLNAGGEYVIEDGCESGGGIYRLVDGRLVLESTGGVTVSLGMGENHELSDGTTRPFVLATGGAP